MKNNENKLIIKVITRVYSSSWIKNNYIGFGTKLTFTKYRLDINYLGILKLSFLKEDITSIELYHRSFVDWFKINHKIEGYLKFLAFRSYSKNSVEILKEIESIGFLDKNSPVVDQVIIDEVRKIQKKEIFPIYLWILVAICIIVLFIYIALNGGL